MKYTTRVELHQADADDYESLHAAMEKRGFSRRITSDDGVIYHLPTAEYNYEGTSTIDEVIAAAKLAAATTGCRYSVLVTESVRRKWQNLSPA